MGSLYNHIEERAALLLEPYSQIQMLQKYISEQRENETAKIWESSEISEVRLCSCISGTWVEEKWFSTSQN